MGGQQSPSARACALWAIVGSLCTVNYSQRSQRTKPRLRAKKKRSMTRSGDVRTAVVLRDNDVQRAIGVGDLAVYHDTKREGYALVSIYNIFFTKSLRTGVGACCRVRWLVVSASGRRARPG